VEEVACDEKNCDACCDSGACTTDILTCPLVEHSDFSVLLTIIIIILSFIIGNQLNSTTRFTSISWHSGTSAVRQVFRSRYQLLRNCGQLYMLLLLPHTRAA